MTVLCKGYSLGYKEYKKTFFTAKFTRGAYEGKNMAEDILLVAKINLVYICHAGLVELHVPHPTNSWYCSPKSSIYVYIYI